MTSYNPAGRPKIPRTTLPCTACGTDVETMVGDVPPVPLRCDACRGPGPHPPAYVECANEGCTVTVRVTGRRLRPWELGRPVTCSYECRRANLEVTRPCGGCGKPLTRLRAGFDKGGYCTSQCAPYHRSRQVADIPCPVCGTVFHPRPKTLDDGGRARTETCSPSCGATLRERRYAERRAAGDTPRRRTDAR